MVEQDFQATFSSLALCRMYELQWSTKSYTSLYQESAGIHKQQWILSLRRET